MIEVIDVTNWHGDEHNAIFPVGARDKEMLWSPETNNSILIKPNWPYLFKLSIDRYPDQYWTELVAYIVSKHLGVDVPKVTPAKKYTDEGVVCGSLIEWFYDVNNERFVHAGSYFKRLIPDFDDKIGKQHNIVDMGKILRFLAMHMGLINERLEWLADMALFDGIIGNTDRHQENWGVIFQHSNVSRLSPLFDNGTSLGHERYLDKIADWDNLKVRNYAKKGHHHLRYRREDTKTRIQHFELIVLLGKADENLKVYIQSKLDSLNLEDMLSEIEMLTRVQIEVPFTSERFAWVKKNIVTRLEIIKEELQNEYD